MIRFSSCFLKHETPVSSWCWSRQTLRRFRDSFDQFSISVCLAGGWLDQKKLIKESKIPIKSKKIAFPFYHQRFRRSHDVIAGTHSFKSYSWYYFYKTYFYKRSNLTTLSIATFQPPNYRRGSWTPLRGTLKNWNRPNLEDFLFSVPLIFFIIFFNAQKLD